jgi:uncharacterized short protein YbdD (DUF466 family)
MSLVESLGRARRGVVWYLKEFTGEARWDHYVEQCRREGVAPMSRRDFERHRADHREGRVEGRCC